MRFSLWDTLGNLVKSGDLMKRTRSEIKSTLLAQIEGELDKALDWQENTKSPNLTAFENQVLSIRKSIGIRVLQEVLKDEESDLPVEIECSTCKSPMKKKGKRPQIIETRLGTLKLEKEYLYCEICREGIFPPIRTITSV